MKNLSIIMIVFIASLLLVTCTKESNPIFEKKQENKNIFVENGRLTFTNDTILSQTITNLLSMNDEELTSWYRQNNFESLWLMQQKAYEELENINSTKEIYNFVDKYKDYFEIIIDENGEENLVEKISNPIYKRIINKNGEYAYRDKINKIINNKLISINQEDYSIIQNMDKNEILTIAQNDDNIVLSNIEQQNGVSYKTSNCGSSKQSSYTRNERGCRHDRKVILEIKTYVVYNSFRENRTVATVYGKRKRACIWTRYKTELNLRDVYVIVKYPVTGTPPGGGIAYNFYSSTIPNQDIESNELVSTVYKEDPFVLCCEASYFYSVKGKASSRGVGNNWAVIDCKP